MTPVYIAAKISAILGAVVVLWQEKWNIHSSASMAALAVGFSALGSLFEKNPTLNVIIGFVTKFLGVPYTPDVPPTENPKV